MDTSRSGPEPRCVSASHEEGNVDYEIEVQELKDKRRSFGRLGVGVLLACVLVLVIRHLV